MEQRGTGWAQAGTIYDRLTGPGAARFSAEQRELVRLASMRTTSDLLTRVENLRAKRESHLQGARDIEALPVTSGISSQTKAIGAAEQLRQAQAVDIQIRQAELDVEDGRRRDALMAERPNGCFCLGAGGKGKPFWIGDAYTWAVPCSCPEGIEIIATYRAAYEEQEARFVAEEEADARDNAVIERRKQIERSGIMADVLAMSWDTYPKPKQGRSAIVLLRRFEAGPNCTPRGVYISGPVGTGKTTLSQLALKLFILAGGGVALAIQTAQWLDHLRESFDRDRRTDEDSHRVLMHQAQRARLLLVDDIGVENITEWGVERLFVLVNYRYEHRLPTIYTSNYDLPQLVGRLARGGADEVRGQRIADRIYDTCDQLEIQGISLRGLNRG